MAVAGAGDHRTQEARRHAGHPPPRHPRRAETPPAPGGRDGNAIWRGRDGVARPASRRGSRTSRARSACSAAAAASSAPRAAKPRPSPVIGSMKPCWRHRPVQQSIDRVVRAVDRERSEHDRRRDPSVSADCALPKKRVARQLAIEKRRGIAKVGVGRLRGLHQGRRSSSRLARARSRCPSPPDVHLAEDGRRAESVGAEVLVSSADRPPARCARMTRQSEAERQECVEWRPSAAIVTGAVHSTSPPAALAMHAANRSCRTAVVEHGTSDGDAGLGLASRADRSLQQRPIEIAPENRQPGTGRPDTVLRP